MVKINMNQQRKLSRHNSRQSSIGETASVGSVKSSRSNSSADFNQTSYKGQQSAQNNNQTNNADFRSGAQPTNILNVAEMLLHGVADNEILDIWLKSIQCEEFVTKFTDAGYDMPTISRITPQDLTAIGVTEPTKRLKILAEIKKLNLQDGIPNFKPASLLHWLSLIRLDSYYYKSLCDQHVDTIEKMCQLTWEDFEELGITKLGHQKRFQLAIERVKELETDTKSSKKPLSEPIYDTNPSQILLVASTENHSMNGPIINKQPSTSELSSTGSGSMHSVYSAASTQYLPNYALPDNQQPKMNIQNGNQNQCQQHAIYSQPPAIIYQQPSQLGLQTSQHYQPLQQQQQQLHTQTPQTQFIGVNVANDRSNGMVVQQNRQLMGQLPFSALANLPKHQQQILQQSSIYATLSRQPWKAKQPPPPVPIRTNSLKTNSLTEEDTTSTSQQQQNHNNYQTQVNSNNTNSTSSLFRSGNRACYRNQFTQMMLSKNKSFSGNAHMEASRSRFLARKSQPPQQQIPSLPQQSQTILNQNNSSFNNQNNIYGIPTNGLVDNLSNGQSVNDNDSNVFRQPSLSNYNQTLQHQASHYSRPQGNIPLNTGEPHTYHGDDYDIHSDTYSTKSLIMPSSSSLVTSLVNNNQFSSPTNDSGSSQTLYNSVSSGSNEQSLNVYNISQTNEMHRSTTTASSCTLNDANPIPESHRSSAARLGCGISSTSAQCNATTGKDDDFPPPPSPLSLSDSDEHDIVSLTSDNNFTDLSRGLMTFRVGT